MMKWNLLVFGIVTALTGCGSGREFRSQWPVEAERPWVGSEYWSNPLQDWRVRAGRLECFVAGGDRNVYLLTRDVSAREGTLEMAVRLGRLEEDTGELEDGFVGFRVGIRGAFDDYRDSAVRGYGLNAGITSDRRLFIGNLDPSDPRLSGDLRDAELQLKAKPEGDRYRVTLAANGVEVSRTVPREWITGGVALVCHSGEIVETPPAPAEVKKSAWADKPGTNRGGTMRFWFRDWTVSGSKVTAHDDRAYGPILFTMYTLTRKTLHLTAQMAPVGNGSKSVALEVRNGDRWKRIAEAEMDADARTATFKVPDWNDAVDTPYRVVYRGHHYEGTVRKDPREKTTLVVAAFTGNNDRGFPHADVVRNVRHHQPDFLAYTGDNIYEGVGEYGTQRAPVEAAILDYLRKWYLFGWEYQELLRDIPAVAIPDDHDVYHGNLWGAGGRHAEGTGYKANDQGGYSMPARFVNAVQRTQTSNLPDPWDPTPVEQGIGVYYTDVTYGGASFAVIEDRKWKSAPRVIIRGADIINGWAQNPRYDPVTQGDVKGAELLGPRQEKFLEEWASDWSGGVWMKVVISQTLFANVATLPKGTRSDAITPKLRVNKPGEYPLDELPVADHDSNSWPQTPRNRALRTMRKAMAFHIAGDQHLGSTVHYGIEEWGDAGWAICVPSVSNFWPRRWFPPQPGRNHKPGMPRYTGEYRDGFGNRVTVLAVSNPTALGIEPTAIHDRAPGYGIIEFDRTTRNITIANWPRWVDVTGQGAKPYEGWPITINQLDNGFPKTGFELDEVRSEAHDPIVQVIAQGTNEIVYTLRMFGKSFTPKVRKRGVYTVKVWETPGEEPRVIRDLSPKLSGAR